MLFHTVSLGNIRINVKAALFLFVTPMHTDLQSDFTRVQVFFLNESAYISQFNSSTFILAIIY